MATYYNIYAVNGRTGRIIVKSGAPEIEIAKCLADGIAIGAQAFQQTAFAVVYEKDGELIGSVNHSWHFVPFFRTEAEFLTAYNNR